MTVGPNGSKPRRYRDRWILLPAVLFSVGVQAAAFATYQLTLPEPDPALTIRLDGAGRGTVLVTKVGDTSPLLRCVPKDQEMERIRTLPTEKQIPATAQYIERLVGEIHARLPGTKQIVGTKCRVELPPGTQVRLTAVLDEEATFEGYAQSPMRPPAQLRPYLGDPLATCLDFDEAAMARGEVRDVMECPITVTANTEVAAKFGLVPKEVDVAFANDEQIDKLIQPIQLDLAAHDRRRETRREAARGCAGSGTAGDQTAAASAASSSTGADASAASAEATSAEHDDGGGAGQEREEGRAR